jgi:hypothetical protein
VRGGNDEGKKGVVIFLQVPLLWTLTWSCRIASLDVRMCGGGGLLCGIPGLVAMATWSRGLGPPLPWLHGAGGLGSGAQLLSGITLWAVETWTEGPAVSRWALGNPFPSSALVTVLEASLADTPCQPLCLIHCQYLKP